MSATRRTKGKASEREIAKAPAPQEAEAKAKTALRPSVNAALVIASYTKPLNVGDAEIGELMGALADDVGNAWAGDTRRAEAMLFGQAHALQAIFMNLARRAAAQEHMKNWEAFLRMAMKAQNQCRMTLETLATIKNPPVVFARQANINNGGQQQVNNGSQPADSRAPAANSATEQTGLLEASDGQRLDTRAAGATSDADPHMAPLGTINRPPQR